MKLIDAPIGIFRFDDELVLKTEYYSENKLNGKYIPDCYIIRTGEYFWGGAKTANELNNLDVEPVDFAELLLTVTDIISRQAAIDAADEIIKRDTSGNNDVVKAMKAWKSYIMALPIAEPQERKGHWQITDAYPHNVYCSKCHKRFAQTHWAVWEDGSLPRKFCPNCGARMEVDT